MKKLLFLLLFAAAGLQGWADEYYLVGDATQIAWSGDGTERQLTRMAETSEGSGVYVWTGLLKHGSEGFKICNSPSGWDGYHPSRDGFVMEGESGTDNCTTDGNDWKWNPSNTDWAWYTITLNKNAGTLSWDKSFTPLEAVNGVISISTAEELHKFAIMVRNNVSDASYNVTLTSDIDYAAYKSGASAVIGNVENKPFRGTFDGQNHTITIDMTADWSRAGLFGTIDANSKVHNLKVAGKITGTTRNQIGGLCGLLKDGAKIYNCLVATEIVDEQGGDGTIGGISAVAYGSSTIENCAFYGKINAPNRSGNGGIVAWSNNGVSLTIKNCLIVADINWGGGEDFSRNGNTLVNSYKTTADDETLGNGQMTYELNNHVSGAEDWFQTLGTDAMPTPLSTSSKLYANGTFYCDGVTSKGGDVVLSNTNAAVIDPHVFGTNGVCTGCHAVGQEAELVDGKYQIDNEGNLLWWGAYVNAGHTDVNAALNADLDMTGIVYTPIGTPDNVYVGSFYGQNHSVTFALDNTPYNYQGLFGVVTDGAWIERVIVKGFIKGNNYVGGIVGGTNGGSNNAKQTNIWHCGNEATITAAEANAAGIIGVNMSGKASIILTNCYNKGDITSEVREAGALSGWLGGGWSSVRNCYNSGTVKNGQSVSKAFGRNNGCYFTNCYYTESSGTDNSTEDKTNGTPALVEDAALASGELCVKLGEDFYQLLGTDNYPVPNDTKPNVYEIAVTDAGYATFVPKKNIAAIPTGVTAYVGQKNGNSLHLETVTALPKNNAFVVKANTGSYYCNSTGEERTLDTSNDLTFSDTEINANGTQYCLANKANGVGFYLVGSGITIPARKAYLEVTASGGDVKAFYGFDDDDATAIEMVNGQSSMVNEIYNLSGQRINKMQKGINIVNGKKILK